MITNNNIYYRKILCAICWGNQKPCNLTPADLEEGQWCMTPIQAHAYEKDSGKVLKDPFTEFVGNNIKKLICYSILLSYKYVFFDDLLQLQRLLLLQTTILQY